ncbi:MAG TPA: collagen-like protein, partial [Prolixibacteraceae bacterium]|nr:collagen-like protein [Prolixibacteraceae bacterium]
MKTKNLFKLSALMLTLLFFVTSCVKEGPMGLQGEEGPAGPAGQNGNENCKVCHNNTVVGPISVQYKLAKHSEVELANEEAGNTACAPCHESEAFKYVIANNTPTAFVLN